MCSASSMARLMEATVASMFADDGADLGRADVQPDQDVSRLAHVCPPPGEVR